MGKIDDMRKRREAQFAQQAGTAGTVAPAAADEPAAVDSTTGKCAVCGKMLALQHGVVGSHQKGFGKFCPGSRKPAA